MQNNKKWIATFKKDLSARLKSYIDINALFHFEIKDFNMCQRYICSTDEINYLIDIEEIRRNKKTGVKLLKNSKWLSIKATHILIAPIAVKTKESFTCGNDPNSEVLFWYFAKVDRSGNLSIPDKTFLTFQPELLRYLNSKTASCFIDKPGDLPNLKVSENKEYTDYTQYIQYIQDLYKDIIDTKIEFQNSNYLLVNNATILLPHENLLLLLELIQFAENIVS